MNFDDIWFDFWYSKATRYLNSPPIEQLTNSSNEAFNRLELILKLYPNNKKTLLNSSWYMLKFIGDSTEFTKCYRYINKLKALDPENPLYLMLEFTFYKQIAYYYFTEGEFGFKFNFNQTALDTLPKLAEHYRHKFRNIHYVRLNILPYLSFNNFRERENYLIKSLEIYENKQYQEQLKSALHKMHFIEVDSNTQRHIAYLTRESINAFLKMFYNKSLLRYFRQQYYHINLNLQNRDPCIKSFPADYRTFVANINKY